MPDEEWIKTLADGRNVKFIYQELPMDGAFLTAQLAGNEIVYSVVLTKAKKSLSREDTAYQELTRDRSQLPTIRSEYRLLRPTCRFPNPITHIVIQQ